MDVAVRQPTAPLRPPPAAMASAPIPHGHTPSLSPRDMVRNMVEGADAPTHSAGCELPSDQLLPSWFEIRTWPLTLEEPESPPGLSETVGELHRLIDDLLADGVPARRVLIGGFSQGGAAAIEAALTYRQPLAGAVAISAWTAHRADLPAKAHAANLGLPLFFSCGTADPIVTFPLARRSGEKLRGLLGSELCSVVHVQRATHPPKRAELDAVRAFMVKCLDRGRGAPPRREETVMVPCP